MKSPAGSPLVTVVIKALNEEGKIARAIESSLAAISQLPGGGEVVLADSLSSDRTVEIARQYPIRVAQLVDPADRSCGAGAQLGYAVSSGAYVYVLDGDMEILPDFLVAGVAALAADPGLAGVAGIVDEQVVSNYGFKNRVAKGETSRPSDNAAALNMGGLYRREAIDSVGYLTNRNLHAFEEFELGVRLRDRGWRLARIDRPAVRHYGHTDESLQLLKRRWRSRYAWGHGELLRSAAGKPYLGAVLRGLRVYRIQFGLAALWAAALLFAAIRPGNVIAVVTALMLAYATLFALMAGRKRSIGAAAYALAAWHVGLAGLMRGMASAGRGDPRRYPAHKVLQ